MNTVQESTTERLHALDGVRAAMMLLGLALHSFIAYGQLDNRGAWPFKDAHTSIICDLIIYFIHLFRMPVFFIMAGFFASMLYEQRRPMGMLRNRVSRILIPLIAGWLVLWPPIIMGYTFAIQTKSLPISQALASAWEIVSSRAPYESGLGHLWFLYYLLMFYGTFFVLVPAVGRLPGRMRSSFMKVFGRTAIHPFRPLWFAIPTAVTLFMTPQGIFLGPNTFIPDYRAYLGYLVFFAFGWLLFHRKEILESCKCWTWTNMILGFLFFFVAIVASAMAAGKKPGAYFVFVLCNALIVWLFAFGITGLFLRFLNTPTPLVRYVVDASYWIYLVHLPIVIWLMGLMTQVEWPALAKGGAVLLGATTICFISYDLLARNTFIGRILNGKRYPRGLPAAEACAPAIPAAVEPAAPAAE